MQYLSSCFYESSTFAGSVFFEGRFDQAKWAGPFASFATELSTTKMKGVSVVGFFIKTGRLFEQAIKKKKVSASIRPIWCYGYLPLVSDVQVASWSIESYLWLHAAGTICHLVYGGFSPREVAPGEVADLSLHIGNRTPVKGSVEKINLVAVRFLRIS